MEDSPAVARPAPSSPKPIRTELIELNLIDIPADTREHDPQEIDASARNQQDVGQLQAIAVLIKEGGRFDLIFGKGRVLAARKAERTQIKADIYQGLTPYQRLNMIYSENERREPMHPIYKGQVLQGMWNTKQFKTKGDLAKAQGLTDSMVSIYLSFLEFPQDALQIFSIEKITYGALKSVKTLPVEVQRQVAQRLKAGTLKPEEVNQWCEGKSKKASKGKEKEPQPVIADPVGPVWDRITKDRQLPADAWRVDYGDRKVAGDKGTALPGWNIWVTQESETPEASLIKVLQAILKALGASARPAPTPPAASSPVAAGDNSLGNNAQAKAPPVMAPRRIAVPVPQIQEASYVVGDKLQITWAGLGEGFTYQVFFADHPESPQFRPIEEGKTVKTPGAVVNVYSGGQARMVLVAVQAIDPGGHPSELSEAVGFELKAWNQEYSVLPLPVAVRMPTAGTPPLVPASAQAAAPAAPVPAASQTPPVDEELERKMDAMLAKHIARGKVR